MFSGNAHFSLNAFLPAGLRAWNPHFSEQEGESNSLLGSPSSLDPPCCSLGKVVRSNSQFAMPRKSRKDRPWQFLTHQPSPARHCSRQDFKTSAANDLQSQIEVNPISKPKATPCGDGDRSRILRGWRESHSCFEEIPYLIPHPVFACGFLVWLSAALTQPTAVLGPVGATAVPAEWTVRVLQTFCKEGIAIVIQCRPGGT